MDKITLTLSAQVYNLIVRAVSEMPWRVANPVFQEIDPQVQAALDKGKESQKVASPTPQE